MVKFLENGSWRVLVLFAGCLAVYIYLYTNVFDGIRTGVLQVVEGDLHAVWQHKVGSVSYYMKFMKRDTGSLPLEVDALPIKATMETTTTARSIKEGPTLSWLVNVTKNNILNNTSRPLLTLFTSWTDNPDKYLVHNITVQNWLSLRPFIIPVVFTNETQVGDECRQKGWEVLPVRVAAAEGVPVLKFMYEDVMDTYQSTFYGYSNGDIVFTNTLIETLVALLNSTLDISKPVMSVGQRTNVESLTEDEATSWSNISSAAQTRGKLFTGYAEDYFITTRSYPWKDIAEVVIGRRAYDNWLVFNARKSHQTVIDATKTLLAVHQTTAAGNFEGHAHKNGNYNHDLLVKMYKRIKYGAGVIECLKHYTKYETPATIQLGDRVVSRHCAV